MMTVIRVGLVFLSIFGLPASSFAPPAACLSCRSKASPTFTSFVGGVLGPSWNGKRETLAKPFRPTRGSQLMASPSEPPSKPKAPLVFLLDPNTRGGSLAYATILFLTPVVYYVYATQTSTTKSSEEIGRDISLIFTVTTTLLWTASYLFRVVSKDMTYAKQLRDYEDAVIEKRMSELDEEEKIGLVEQIQREES